MNNIIEKIGAVFMLILMGLTIAIMLTILYQSVNEREEPKIVLPSYNWKCIKEESNKETKIVGKVPAVVIEVKCTAYELKE